MKKFLALMLTVALCFSCTAVSYAEALQIDTSFDGVVFTYEDINMQLKVPADWYRGELLPEYVEAGYFDCFVSPEGAFALLNLLDSDIETILATLEADETVDSVQLVTVNDIQAITYVDLAHECYATIFPFADGSQSVVMLMGPVGDETMAATLLTLIATVDTIA